MNQQQQGKAAFFALYLQQPVLEWDGSIGGDDYPDFVIVNNLPIEDYYLRLSDLKDIADEDAIECGRLHNWTDPENFKRHFLGFQKATPTGIKQIDFFRSRGYLLPFRQYSTEQILEMGWCKLKTK